jgi:hypothetical protein
MIAVTASIRPIFVLGLSLGLLGCPFSVTRIDRRAVSEPLARPASFDRPGPLLHEASGLEFAEWYDGFQRVSAYRFDTAGENVGIGYNDRRQDCLIVATFYLYPTPPMSFVGAAPSAVASVERSWLEGELARSKAELEHHHPRMESPSLDTATTPLASGELQGASFRFRELGNNSELRLFVYQQRWFLKYRLTHPESCQAEAAPRIDALVRRLPWATSR